MAVSWSTIVDLSSFLQQEYAYNSEIIAGTTGTLPCSEFIQIIFQNVVRSSY